MGNLSPWRKHFPNEQKVENQGSDGAADLVRMAEKLGANIAERRGRRDFMPISDEPLDVRNSVPATTSGRIQ
jgi:hypothetical protein